MDARGKFGEHERSVRVVRGDSREQLLRFFRALQTSRVQPLLDIRTLSMSTMEKFTVKTLLSIPQSYSRQLFHFVS